MGEFEDKFEDFNDKGQINKFRTVCAQQRAEWASENILCHLAHKRFLKNYSKVLTLSAGKDKTYANKYTISIDTGILRSIKTNVPGGGMGFGVIVLIVFGVIVAFFLLQGKGEDESPESDDL